MSFRFRVPLDRQRTEKTIVAKAGRAPPTCLLRHSVSDQVAYHGRPAEINFRWAKQEGSCAKFLFFLFVIM